MARKSAWSMTVVIQLVVLSERSGSVAVLPATTRLVITPVEGAFTVTPRFVDEPPARLATDQNTLVRLALVAPLPVALINVRFGGKLSVTTRLVAAEGPPFDTVIE